MAGGEYCAIWLGPELPGDQRGDDGKSLCFDGDILDAALDIVGAPVVRLKLSADRPSAMVAVRLCDIQPDGASTRISYGVLNLCHRDGHETPRSRCARRDDGDRVAARRRRLQRRAGPPVAAGNLLDLLAAGLAVAGAGDADAARRRSRSAGARLRERATRPRSRSRKARRPGASKRCAKAPTAASSSATMPAERPSLAIVDDFGECARSRPWAGAWRRRPRALEHRPRRPAFGRRGNALDARPCRERDGRCAPKPSRRCDPTRRISI